MSRLWVHLEGVCLFLTLLALVIGLVGHLIHTGLQPLDVNLRMFDNLRPHLLLLALGGAVLLGLMGMRWITGGIALAVVLGLALIAVDYRARIAPSGTQGVPLTLLWMNLLKDNPVAPETLATAIRSSGADIVILAEAAPAFAAKPLLSDLYPHQAGCPSAASCGLLLLSQHPLSGSDFGDLPSGPERLLHFTVALPGGLQPAIVAAHREKPWFVGLADTDDDWLRAVLSRRGPRPLIFVGDFNAAPWSRRLGRLWREQRFRHAAIPVATWPASAGRFGLPIDHVLVRYGVQIEDMAPWGLDLGSNHRGLLARLHLPPAPDD